MNTFTASTDTSSFTSVSRSISQHRLHHRLATLRGEQTRRVGFEAPEYNFNFAVRLLRVFIRNSARDERHTHIQHHARNGDWFSTFIRRVFWFTERRDVGDERSAVGDVHRVQVDDAYLLFDDRLYIFRKSNAESEIDREYGWYYVRRYLLRPRRRFVQRRVVRIVRRFYRLRVFGRFHRQGHHQPLQDEQLVENIFDEFDKYTDIVRVGVVYGGVIARRSFGRRARRRFRVYQQSGDGFGLFVRVRRRDGRLYHAHQRRVERDIGVRRGYL